MLSEIRPANGRWAIVGKDPEDYVVSTKFMVLRPNLELVLSDFVYLFLTSNEITKKLQQVAEYRSATFPQITFEQVAEIEIRLPTMDEQRSIVTLIKSIDEKVASNRIIAKTLEEIAQAIFKSWFIDFDPVKAKMAGEKPVGMDDATAALFPDSMVDSELGPIPKGWKNRRIDDLGKVVTGKTPSTKEGDLWGEEVPFVTIPDMHGQLVITGTRRFLSKKGANSQKNQYLPKGSTLVSCIATPGLVAYAADICQSNQQINSVIPNDEHPAPWLFWHLRNMIATVVSRSGTGTVFANLNKSDFSSIESLVPTKSLRTAYSDCVEDMLLEIEALRREAQLFESLRDLLLPRLISGELQIPEEMLGA